MPECYQKKLHVFLVCQMFMDQMKWIGCTFIEKKATINNSATNLGKYSVFGKKLCKENPKAA